MKYFILLILISGLVHCNMTPKSVEFEPHQLDTIHGKNLVADMDGDGRNDIVTIGGKDQSVVLYRYNPDNSFTKSVLVQDIYMRGDRIETSDIDKDGDLDLVAGVNENDNLFVTWIINPQLGGNDEWELVRIGFQGTEKSITTAYIKDIAVADFNKDGLPDVVTRTNIKTRIFSQHSPVEWSAPIVIEHHHHEGMDIGDMDGDGDTDIVLNGFWLETPQDLSEEFKKHIIDDKWFGQTEGTWRDDNASVKVSDMNNDGLPDVLISHSEKPGYPIALYTAKSYEEIKQDKWTEIKVAGVYDFCQTLDAGDIDNDGIFWNIDGEGTQWKEEILSDKGLYAGTLGDVGSDGDLDIVGPRSYWTGPTDFYENMLK